MNLRRAMIALSLCLAASIAVAAEPAGSDADQRLKRLLERANAQSAGETLPAEARQQMLAAGEAALARGEAEAAAQQFERAGMVKHEADAELGLIRAYMQAGEYRRALAFAAHTAGAHPQTGAGSALYAWLLHIGGQAKIAAQLLDKARARLPDDAVLQAITSLIQSPLAAPAAELLAPPARFAPYSAESSRLPPAAEVIASGVLIDGGRIALTAAAALGSAREVWVRNGLGQVTAAKVVRSLDDVGDVGVAQLHLAQAIAVPAPTLPPRDPFPGSPGFAVEFPAIANAAPGWPLLRVGFLGKPSGMAGVFQLGIAMSRAYRGGPVFDANGRLIGIAISGNTDGDRLVLASHLRKHMNMNEAPEAPAQMVTSERIAVDEIYERALKITVQVIAVR
jgi:tetratricopeptide (TPR) repeat protein